MRKYGKYEKMPEVVPEKQSKVKSPLLQTYLTSLLCMVLCVTMFFGTSFAWFTSEVSNEGNEIYIGTLDVGLFKKSGDQWVDLDESDTKLFDGSIRWEPGYTTMETIQIKNEGDLAFLYELSFINNETDMATLEKVGKNFVVYVHAGDYAEGETVPESFADIKANAEQEEESKRTWQPIRIGTEIATLADIIGKEIPVLSDSMTDVREDTTDPTAPTPGPNDSKPTEDTYIIALHMIEDTKDPEIMGHKVQLNVKLVAYQTSSENDSFGKLYDDLKIANNAEDLSNAVAGGGDILLDGIADLGGKSGAYLSLTEDTTISGGTIKGTGWTGESNIAVKASDGDIVFDGVTFDTNDWTTDGWATWGMSVNVSGTTKVTFKNCTFKGSQCPIYLSGADSVVILENCKFETSSVAIQCEIYSGDFALGQDLIVKNCDFTGVADVLHICDYDKDPSSDAIAQYLTDNGNTFTGSCKQTYK